MNIESIKGELQRLLKITQGWQSAGEVSPIERDIALDGVKRIYEQLVFSPSQVESVAPQGELKPEVEVELTYYQGEEEIDGDEEGFESEEEQEEGDEPTFELGDISIIADGEPTQGDGVLFDISEIPVRTKSRRSAILSLYGENPTTTPHTAAVETKPEPKPLEIVEEIPPAQPETIAQRYASEIKNSTLSDNSQIGTSINDRYIIAQELFGGSMAAYDQLLSTLEKLPTFDDCMIYVVENYDWDAESEAAKLFVSTLKQRFSK